MARRRKGEPPRLLLHKATGVRVVAQACDPRSYLQRKILKVALIAAKVG
ncbi:MAG: hypothetical protein WCL32_24095 [Planctomycetota bacterium]